MSGYELLARDLAACGRDGFTGEVRVSGSPGGTFHLHGGLVVAVESPGAPAPEALLLRSGRIGGEEWAGLVRESGGARWPATGLIAHGYAGAAQLRVVCAMALQDATFAVVAGGVDGCERGPANGPPPASVTVGEPPTRLLQEASRKLRALLALPYPVSPDRERPVPASLSYVAARLGVLQRELLAHADGRRTARDLAFRTGRGVYTVTVEVARMLGEGLLECVDAPRPIPVRLPPDGHGVRPREPAPPPPPQSSQPSPSEAAALPRRRPGASGINEALMTERNGTGWKEFFRLRNPTAK
ncbi:MarR family transcriptional regulator [Streptomyces sp. NBC_01235]|uniref:MarR family transcriptional regulator n=1 Tax=Streptomyces sp. NBC_01235 TaxID=2903788 RepID=UPI002E0DDDED|nr:MarR family transcriptional regulator [Streptomyces sp. NBC_01235]